MSKSADFKASEIVTLDDLKHERSDLWEAYQVEVERFRKMLWYRCSPGSVDRINFPKADAERIKEFAEMVLEETGKVFKAPRLPPYKDGNILF